MRIAEKDISSSFGSEEIGSADWGHKKETVQSRSVPRGILRRRTAADTATRRRRSTKCRRWSRTRARPPIEQGRPWLDSPAIRPPTLIPPPNQTLHSPDLLSYYVYKLLPPVFDFQPVPSISISAFLSIRTDEIQVEAVGARWRPPDERQLRY